MRIKCNHCIYNLKLWLSIWCRLQFSSLLQTNVFHTFMSLETRFWYLRLATLRWIFVYNIGIYHDSFSKSPIMCRTGQRYETAADTCSLWQDIDRLCIEWNYLHKKSQKHIVVCFATESTAHNKAFTIRFGYLNL